MRYGAIAENALEEQMLAAPQAPRALFDTFVPLVQARAIIAGVRLGVFNALAERGSTCGELADSLALNPEALELVLRLLVGSGYLVRDGEEYGLTELARQTLLDESPAPVIAFVGLNELEWGQLAHTNDVIRDGRGIDLHRELHGPESWGTYQAAMLEVARGLAPLVAQLVPVKSGAQRLLDIGGSHGLYGGLICRAHPPMQSVVLDLPEAVEQSRRLAQEEGIADVVTHRVGEAHTDALGKDLDVVFLGNILHHFSPEKIEAMLARVRSSLRPGGTVAIWEIRRPEPDEPPDVVGDGFALLFRVTSTARCYTAREYTDWLTGAGFVEVQTQPLPVAPFQVLLTGRAPGGDRSAAQGQAAAQDESAAQ